MMNSVSFTEEFLRSIDVRELLPQQPPFVMTGCLIDFQQNTSTTETIIEENNIFVDNGEFSASGLMENIAQTCAARIGFYNKYVLHKDVQIGFIGSVRNFVIESRPKAGSKIHTRVDILEEIFGMTLANAEVRCENRIIANAEIKLAVRNAEQIKE